MTTATHAYAATHRRDLGTGDIVATVEITGDLFDAITEAIDRGEAAMAALAGWTTRAATGEKWEGRIIGWENVLRSEIAALKMARVFVRSSRPGAGQTEVSLSIEHIERNIGRLLASLEHLPTPDENTAEWIEALEA